MCGKDPQKDTIHLVLDLKDSGIKYIVGDSVAIIPANDPAVVQRTLDVMNATGEEIIQDKRSGTSWQLREYLTQKANIKDLSKKFLLELCARQTNSQKKDTLEPLLAEGAQDKLKEFQTKHEVWDALKGNPEAHLTPQEVCNLLMPMIPRFYSIASSMNAVGEEMHLTIAIQKWNSNGQQRLGVCTHYLCNLVPLNQADVPIYIQPHKGFTLPADPKAPIIMVGPGTGIAPFRAFMQERESLNCTGENWLFFGECHCDHHFFYEQYWKSLESKGKLRLDVAFSRDQERKIYVQHRMLENGKDLFQWIRDGAFLYVCGNACCMAKGVDAALHQIVQQYGNLTEEKTKEYVKQLRSDKRYIRDIY